MKKLLLVFFTVLFTTLSSNAAAIVSYGPGGVPLSMQLGPKKYSVVGDYYHFGENALASPQNIARQRMRRINNQIRRRNTIAEGYVPTIKNSAGVLPSAPVEYTRSISRFNRNYRISAPRKSYTRNGITYYN